MREMKDSGIEWIGDIPKEWEIIRLCYLIDGYKAGPFGSALIMDKLDDEGEILVYTPETIATRDTDLSTNKYLPDSRRQEMEQFFVEPGDIIFPIVGSLGRAMLIKKNMPEGIINQRLAKFHLSSDKITYPYFMRLFGQSSFFETYIELSCRGSIIVNLTKAILHDMPVPVPPIDEQKRIAAYLDSKCSEIDALTADIQSQIDTLEQYKRSVITEAVTRGLDKNVEMKDSGFDWLGFIPSTWQTRKGKYIFVQRNERGNSIELQLLSPTQKYGVIPQDLYEEISGYKAVKLDEKTDYSLLKTIHKGDYCISLRSFQGGFEYSEYEGVVSPAYQVFYPVIEVFRDYYKHLFKTQIFIDKMNSFTMSLRDGKNIAFADFGNTYLPIPPIQEQQRIADYLDRKCAEIDSIITEKKQQIETIEEYKKSLIFEYVTGKKEVPAV